MGASAQAGCKARAHALDSYLVLAGPPSATVSWRGPTPPWRTEAVFLFDAR